MSVTEIASESAENGGYPFNDADRRKAQLAMSAGHAATKRLRKAHAEHYEQLVNEERSKRGLPPRPPKLTLREMNRLARLALEVGLG